MLTVFVGTLGNGDGEGGAGGPASAPDRARSGAIPAASDAAVVDCDVGGLERADLAAVEAIARLSLVARRSGGRRLRLCGTPPELRLLIGLVGLADVLALAEESP
ncbi:STAS domain-containing protein [Streptomyces sp. NPDC002746]